MINLRSLADGYERDHSIIFPVECDAADDAAVQRVRTWKLAVIVALLDAGMPTAARAAAACYDVQFQPKTLRRWRRGVLKGPGRARTTYAFLVLGR